MRNNIRIVGDGHQIIVMAHGFGCDQKMWQYILPYFEMNYRVVLFDYVGSGQSDLAAYDRKKYNTLHGYKRDLLDVLESLQLTNVIYVGHSVSSMIGMLAAIEKPEYFERIVMIGPSPCYLNDDHYKGGFDHTDIEELLSMMEMNFGGWASYMAPYAMGVDGTNILTDALSESFRTIDQTVAKQFAEATFYSDHREDLVKCVTPTFILQCSDDSIVPNEVGHFLHKQLKNSELYVLDSKGHYPHISEPKKTSDIIHHYLNRHAKENGYA